MANYLDANPDIAEQVAGHRSFGGLAPVAQGGELVMFINRRSLDRVAPDASITAEDYVVGLEVLGYTFEVVADPKRGHLLGQYDPTAPCPEGWHAHALALMRAMPSNRSDEVIAFLIERDGLSEKANSTVFL